MAKEDAPSINGTVIRDGQPAGSVYVRLVGPSGEFVAEEYTKDDGVFEFHVAPGTWTIEARGIQCAFDGIGRTGLAGILPPTSAKIQTKSTLKPWPAARDRATSA